MKPKTSLPARNEDEKIFVEARYALEDGNGGRVIQAADELLKRDPQCVDALFLAGVAFMRAKNEGLALQFFNVARQTTKKPEALAAIWNNIGCCLQDYRPEEAYAALKECLNHGSAAPASTFDNLCNVASQIGRHEEALEWAAKSEAAMAGGPGADPSYNRSFALLHLGRWREAWLDMAKCIHKRGGAAREYGLPRWRGEKGARLLVHGEQGIGDEILFMSMLPAEFDGVIECNARNASLFARSFPRAAVHGTLGASRLDWLVDSGATHHLEMGGLGEFFAAAPFVRSAYLRDDDARRFAAQAWLDNAAPVGGLRVGLAWTGGSWSTGRARRSVPFYEMLRLRNVPGAQFVNLEYEDRRAELAAADVDWLDPHWATRKGADMDDLAALVASLDLVISATTSVVDLAGALGVPVWVMADEHPQWRYALAAGERSMWVYESARVFRQEARDHGQWTRVVSQVMNALRELNAERRAAA